MQGFSCWICTVRAGRKKTVEGSINTRLFFVLGILLYSSYCRRPLSLLKNIILANVLSCSRTVTTLPQVAAWRVVATNLAQIHFSVMIQESVSAKTTPLAKSVTYVSGDSLGFLMPHAKVGNCTASFLTCINFAKSIRVIVTFILRTTFG